MTELQNQVIIENEIEITHQQMFDLFRGLKSNEFIHLETLTKVKMNKTDNPYFEQIFKHNKCTYMVVVDYSKRVNNNRIKEGNETEFIPQVPRGFVKISECLYTDEKTGLNTYLSVERFNEIKPNVTYFFNESEIEKSQFESFLPPISKPKSQGLDRVVNYQRFDFKSIMRFTFRKNKYKVIHQ